MKVIYSHSAYAGTFLTYFYKVIIMFCLKVVPRVIQEYIIMQALSLMHAHT